VADDEDGDVEYDADGNPIAPVRSKFIDPLPPIDHSLIAYKPFEKNFYVEHTDIAGLSPIQVRNFFYLSYGGLVSAKLNG
jgi:ATP-dependent RNA helicase DDX42